MSDRFREAMADGAHALDYRAERLSAMVDSAADPAVAREMIEQWRLSAQILKQMAGES